MFETIQSVKVVTGGTLQQAQKITSPAILRLLQEVRNKDGDRAIGGSYDRTHNRHNRG